jgi:hypothetical protein
MRYGTEQLASAGFVIFDTKVAMHLRPDLWTTGMECGHDLMRLYSRQVANEYFAPKCVSVTLNLDGIGEVQVLTRSLDQLEKRVEWLTGFRVIPAAVANVRAAKKPLTTPLPPVAAPVRLANGDVFDGIVTAEPGRTCRSCENLSVGHACTQHGTSGVEVPNPMAMRRCPAYQPNYGGDDDRTGAQLWPELKLVPAKEATHGCV